MPSAGGNITQKELESYSSANIMLMSNDNGDVQTGSDSGSSTYNWYLGWNSNGFIGFGWYYIEESELSSMDNVAKANLAAYIFYNGRGVDGQCADFSLIV